jgi:hypothetical protein
VQVPKKIPTELNNINVVEAENVELSGVGKILDGGLLTSG